MKHIVIINTYHPNYMLYNDILLTGYNKFSVKKDEHRDIILTYEKVALETDNHINIDDCQEAINRLKSIDLNKSDDFTTVLSDYGLCDYPNLEMSKDINLLQSLLDSLKRNEVKQ